MASTIETVAWLKYRRFWFNPEAFKQGKAWIETCMEQQADIVVIDEVGPMELESSGWSESLDSLQNASVPVQLWSVSETLSGEVMKHWDIPSDQLLPIDSVELSQAAELIGRAVERNRNS